MCVLLTEDRTPAIAIWHFSAYVDSLRIDALDSGLATTVISTQFLAFAAIFTAALPVITKMPQKSRVQHELEEGRWKDEVSTSIRQTSTKIGEQVESRETARGRPSQDTRPAPNTPPSSPRLPPPARGPTLPARGPTPPSPTSPKLPALSACPSNSTLQESTKDGLFAHNATVPPTGRSGWSGWSAIGND